MEEDDEEIYPDFDDDDLLEEKQLRHMEIAAACKCGAIGFDGSTMAIVADCCCGAF